MTIAVVLNSKAGSTPVHSALFAELRARPDFVILNSETVEEFVRSVREAAGNPKYRCLLIAGGDGTIHAAVNALGPKFPPIPLAVLPLGTGNDLCRTLDIPLNPVEALELLKAPRVRRLDVVRVEGGIAPFLINAATGGFSGKVASEVTTDRKGFWGPLAYLRGAVGNLTHPPSYRVSLRIDGGKPIVLDALNVVVANARTAAGGFVVSPRSDPEDGLLDVIVVRSGDFADRTVITARLMAGDYHRDELVLHRRAVTVELESEPAMPFSMDGEVVESARYRFEVISRAVPFVVGPHYHHDPRGNWRGLRRRIMGRVAGVLDAATRLARGDRIAIGGIILAVLIFALLAAGVTQDRWTVQNEAVLHWLRRQSSPRLDQMAGMVTRLGSLAEILAIMMITVGVMSYRRHHANAVTILVVMLGCGVLEVVLKAVFAISRPDVAHRVIHASWYSFPSGHAIRAVGLYGCMAGMLLAARPKKFWRWGVAAVLLMVAASVCWTRVYLGVHWLTDVIAGGLAAVAWVGCCLFARRHIVKRRQTRTKPLNDR